VKAASIDGVFHLRSTVIDAMAMVTAEHVIF